MFSSLIKYLILGPKKSPPFTMLQHALIGKIISGFGSQASNATKPQIFKPVWTFAFFLKRGLGYLGQN